MKCTINDINLSFDKDNRIRKTILRVTGHDADKAYVLASFLYDAGFKQFLLENITKDDVLKGETISFDNMSINDFVKLKQNKFGSLLNLYYIEHYHSVDNSKTKKGLGRLNGFTSASAKTVAKNYNASLLITEYRKEFSKPKDKRRKPLEIIAEVNKQMLNTFYDRTNDFARFIINDNSFSQEAKEYANKYLEILKEINEVNENITNITSWGKATTQVRIEEKTRLNKLKKENASEELIKESTDKINKLGEEITANAAKRDEYVSRGATLTRDKYVIAQNLVALYSNDVNEDLGIRLRNYANLVAQTRGDANAWYFQVFNTKTMTSIIKDFNNVGDIEEFMQEQEEDDDAILSQYDGQTIDETTKSWEDHNYKNFNQAIDSKLRIILSSIPKLAEKYNIADEVQALDTNNELGVPTFMDAQFITVQIFSFADFTSVDSMINSLDIKSKSIKNLYGLGQIVNMMKRSKSFANYMYANFAKPVVNKTMLVISDIANENGISFDYSNVNAFPLTELVFRMANKLRSTYNSVYDSKDIEALKDIQTKYNKSKDKSIIVEDIFDIVSKYFPNFNKQVFNNYFDNLPTNEADESINQLIRNIAQIITSAGNLKANINNIEEENRKNYESKKEAYYKAKKEYNKAINDYNKLSNIVRANTKKPEAPVFPTYPRIDYANYELSKTAYKSIIAFAKQIVNYTESKARLNSTNAEGTTGSDVIKNCFISRFFEQIMAESATYSNAGLENLKKYITQGTDNGQVNQYSNNPLFFGVKDENGNVIVPGMFTRTATGYEVNPNAKEILKLMLFDGSRNNQDGLGDNYASMSKVDFFITQYMAFTKSINEATDEGFTKKIGNLDSAVYPMRIGSDAPKIFFIRAPRYNDKQVRYALYNHVIDELNMMITGINNLFVQDGDAVIDGNMIPLFKTRKDITNLIGRAFFNENKANELKKQGKTDFTSAIVEKGRLTGKLFNFYRLFNVNGYKASEAIESMLSLYGQGDKAGIMSIDKDGRMVLTQNDTIVWDGTKFVLNLSDEQKQELKNIVRTWADNFLIEAKSRTSGFIKILTDNNISYSQNELDSFLLNAANMNMNYDDLFEGDYKYYNKARDFLKRTKETQAGGDGYAGFNVLEDYDNDIKELKWRGRPEVISLNSTAEFNQDSSPVERQVIINNKPLIARNGWRGVTIYNTNKASDYADNLQKELERIFIKQGLGNEVAKNRSVAIARGYGLGSKQGTIINDAQSYITLEEFIRRRHADGTIQDYADIINQLIDDTPVENINIDDLNNRIQVQKNFYFDKVFDKDTGLFYPRQIKNAEFVLIPKLLPEGSELRKVHDWMQKNDIGQLNTAETSKAAKKNIFTIWDVETGEFNVNFEEDFNNSYIENYTYQYLYKQQEVPQHIMNENNKAGIQIMKKIIDNIINESEKDNSERKRLKQYADEYLDAYTANIKDDFNTFLDRMGWEYDIKLGKIVNSEYQTTDINGDKLPNDIIKTNRETLNFNNFYARAREEAARLGMDSNFIEYLIPNEFGRPTMPNWQNAYSSKLESIAQAIYNRSITRQILPGWHAAQITDVGYSKRLKFDPKTGVMEVYLPRWSNLIPKGKTAEEDTEILKQISEEGLDIHLGYRIPTEGKQSIAVLKVVGFTNDCLGSTIVVPAEWVTQTGSDFDVDSVYGICWEMYATKDKNGKTILKKVAYEETDVNDQDLYIRYVNNKLDARVKRTDIGEEIESSIKEVRDRINNVAERNSLNEEYNKLDDSRNKLFASLPNWAKYIIDDTNKKAKTIAKRDKVVTDLRSVYSEINSIFTKYLEKYKISDDVKSVVEQYMDYQTSLIDVMNRQEGLPGFDKDMYRSEKAEAIQRIVEQAKQEYFNQVQQAAKKAGIMDYDTWSKQSFVDKLSKRARNNYILDRMIKIMNDETSREEQYGRSKFENIVDGEKGANDIIDKISGETSKSRSPYNPLDQLDYFEDAMGGARLKALSVMWDTFTSKNNKVRAFLDDIDVVEVILTMDGLSAEDSVIEYNKDDIKKSYDKDIQIYEENNKNKFIFKARRIGFSNTNRNIVGELVTTYTSQTTAHHLDAVKMGSVPNVDEYTFSTYKLLSTLGIDYETIIGFIRQPAITNLVANNNLINSVFLSSKNNPIKMTINDIAANLGIKNGKYKINHTTALNDVIDALKNNNNFKTAFTELFNIDISSMSNEEILNIKSPLDKQRLFTRIKRQAQNKGDVYQNAAFDLGVILTFRNIRNTAEKINRLIRATNADKFGAINQIRENRAMIDLINELRKDKTLSKKGVSFIDLIYPTIDNNNSAIDINNSEYKSIAAIYSYATLRSFETNTQVFVTENEDFAASERIVQQVIHHKLSPKEYAEYKRYAISGLYNKVQKLLTPLTIDKRGNIIPDNQRITDISNKENDINKYWDAERSRIYGYGIANDGNFKVENLNNPTEEDIVRFNNLTPAQKVLFIQRHFPDHQGIFNYIKVTLLNNTDVKYKGISRQYLSYDDQIDNIEDLLYMFINSFSNKNKFIRLAAIDLVKYAYIAEGFNYKSGYISKIIPNSVLYTRNDEGGFDIINNSDPNNSLNSMIYDLPYDIRNEEFIENFIRSHSNIAPIFRLSALPDTAIDEYGNERYVYQNKSTTFKSLIRPDGLIYLDGTSTNKFVIALIKHLQINTYNGGFIKVNFPISKNESKTVLFAVESRNEEYNENGEFERYQDYFLVPLNLLDKYENYDYSYNENFNVYNDREYYTDIVDAIARTAKGIRETNKQLEANKQKLIDVTSASNKNVSSKRNTIGSYKAESVSLQENKYGLTEYYNNSDNYISGPVKKLVDGIVNHIESDVNFTTPYIQYNPSVFLKNLIPAGDFVVQTVDVNGVDVDVIIAHLPNTNKFNKAIRENDEYKSVRDSLKETNTSIERADIYRVIKHVPKKVYATTDLIVEPDETVVESSRPIARRGKSKPIDVLSSIITKTISYEARRNETAIAERFVKELEHSHVNKFSRSSLSNNRISVYRAAARYYRSASNAIINKLNKFVIDSNEYSMDDEAMYEALISHDEYFREVAQVILDGITFGNQIADIFKLDITAEDPQTKEAVESIINSINAVRQNSKLNEALNNVINIYFKKYSTNPEIMRDILELRETFGDLDNIDAWISNPADIDNNEVQVIIKQVYNAFAKAELFDVRKNIKEWEDELAKVEAMNDSFEINNVIDFEHFRIKPAYKNKFLEDRQKVIDELNEAMTNRYDDLSSYNKYLRAKFARDKFMFNYTHQIMIDDYYRRDLAMREEVMKKGGSLYTEFMMLRAQLYDDNLTIGETIEQTAERKARINNKIKQLLSKADIVGNEKSFEEQAKIDAINNYLSKYRDLQDEYFEDKEYDGFQEDYVRYKEYLDNYNIEHPDYSFERKMQNIQYRDAYNWIKSNGRIQFSKEESKKLTKAFKDLIGRNTVLSNSIYYRLKNIPGIIDEAGNIDATKLTKEQIKQIRDEAEFELSQMYDDGTGELILIKSIPSDIPIMMKKGNDNESKEIMKGIRYTNDKEKARIIGRINEIIGKAVDRKTGKIDIAVLFNDDVVSYDEREELADLYIELKSLRSEFTKNYLKKNNKVFEEHIDTSYLSAMLYYKTNLKNTKQGSQFLKIFTELDENGNMVANSYIFGYRQPKPEYIDNERTNARDYLNDNVEFVTTEYYDIARREAESKGEEEFNKWFKLNHIYNPYTHKYEPLKIWTKLSAKPGSKLAESISYTPMFQNMERTIRDDKFINKNYKKFSNNYRTGSTYDTGIVLSDKEKALQNLLTQTLNKYATTYQGKRFVAEGYLPRERQNEINSRWVGSQLLSLMGLDWHSGTDSDSYQKEVDYTNDREADMDMLSFLKTKGTKKYLIYPNRNDFDTEEEYRNKLNQIKEENRKIKAENEKLDNAIVNKDWKAIMKNFVHNATIFNSRQAAKPYIHLLLEDLAANNAYAIDGMWNKHLIKDSNTSTEDDTRYKTIPQTKTRQVVSTLAHRLLFNEYHKNSTPRAIANFLQNMTSAKYMIFNAYGGVANVATGKVNIFMEESANEYFGFKEFHDAELQYLSNSVQMIQHLYSDKAPNLTIAFIKQFNIVNFDQVLQFGDGSANLDESLKRFRNWMYSFQSIGEHYMQNSVLLAMLKSNRLYTDRNGVQRIGDFKDYTWDVEQKAMEDIISNNSDLLIQYEIYKNKIKYDLEEKLAFDTGRKDYNRNFLYMLRDNENEAVRKLYKDTANAYHKRRKELLDKAKEEFIKNDTVESLFELINGEAVLKQEKVAAFNAKGKNAIGDLEHLIGGFKKKVEEVNHKIHGVYDKISAAQLETKWYGSIVMQYHKHLYTGIFKRWRRKGFYSEFRGSRERGSYQTLIDFLGTEFTNFNKRVKNKSEEGEFSALASIQVAMESLINSLVNIQFNWQNLSNWERANIKRNLGEMSGVLVAALVVMALYGLNDDDDIKDDPFKASLLYLADRLYSDTTMYSPLGLISEAKTAWSSPIASANGPSDLIKAMMLIPKALFDPDYNPEYQTGQYRGENKLEILLRRNIPGIRPYDRIRSITRNNKYYKIGESQIGINIAKNIGKSLRDN